MTDLLSFHAQSMERINSAFFERGDGVAATRERSSAVDQIVTGLFDLHWPEPARQGLRRAGRGRLRPPGAVSLLRRDLLFLFDQESAAKASKESLASC
jgi:hypothetical protein